MDKKFINVVDKDVAVYYVYADASGNACYDAAFENKMIASDLKKAFHVGCVVVNDGVEYRPVHMVENDGVVTLTYVTTDDSTATTAVLATVVSVADA